MLGALFPPNGRYALLVALTASLDLFICAKDLFVCRLVDETMVPNILLFGSLALGQRRLPIMDAVLTLPFSNFFK